MHVCDALMPDLGRPPSLGDTLVSGPGMPLAGRLSHFKPGLGCWTDTAAQLAAASSQYFSLAAAEAGDFSPGNADFGGSLWLYPTTLNGGVCGKFLGSTNQREWLLYLNSGWLYFAVFPNGIASGGKSVSIYVGTGSWKHAVFYHDSVNDVIGLVVNDGTPATTAHAAGVFQGTANFEVGSYENGANNLDGRIDSLNFYNAVPTATQITALYNAGLGTTAADMDEVLTQNLVSSYDFNQAQGYDSYGANDLTAVNSPTIAQGIAVGQSADGDPISTWWDLAHARHKVQPTVAMQPTLDLSTGINGRAAVLFDGVDDFFYHGNDDYNDSATGLYAVVFEPNVDEAVVRNIMGMNRSDQDNNYHTLYVHDGNLKLTGRDSDSPDAIIFTTTAIAADTPCVVIVWSDGAASAARVNGVAQATSGTNTGKWTDLATRTGVKTYIGGEITAGSPGGSNWFSGRLGDVLEYAPNYHNAPGRSALEKVLATKYGIAV